MDTRWKPISRDSKREIKVLVHPTASIADVRRGVAADPIDVSEFVQSASHTAFDARVSLVFNRELFGETQPKPYQVLEFQLKQDNEWKLLWTGHIDSIDSFTLSRGERSMQLIAKTREQQDLWKYVSRSTPLFPQLTNLTHIAQMVARSCDLKGDEIAFPPSAIMTAHSNTQLADMNAWDMISSVFVALGWTPFIDVRGSLRAADRNIQDRPSDITLVDSRIVRLGGQRLRPPVSRVRVSWLNPQLVRWKQQTRMLTSVPVTIGWFLKEHTEKISYSEDGTQRATETKFVGNPGVEKWSKAAWCDVTWIPDSETGGKLHFDNTENFEAYLALLAVWIGSGFIDFTPVIGGIVEGGAQAAFFTLLLKMGPGVYEIWGTPYDYVHALNISEAFDSSVPVWINNTAEIRCDFVVNEQHGRAIAIRELIYQSAAASKWSVSLVDDPRIEFGDLLEFPDGSRLFVEDFTREVTRGSEAVLEVKGFLIGALPQRGKVCPLPAGTIFVGGFGPDNHKCVFMSPDGKKFYKTPSTFDFPGRAFSAFSRTSQGHITVAGAGGEGDDEGNFTSGVGVLNRCTLAKQCEDYKDEGVTGNHVTASDGLGFWYSWHVFSNILYLCRYNIKGDVVALWEIPFPVDYSWSVQFAGTVSHDGNTLFTWLNKDPFVFPSPEYLWTRIGIFDLTEAGTWVGFLSTDNANSPGYGSMITVPGSDDIIVAFNTENNHVAGMPRVDGAIRRYTTVATSDVPAGYLVWEAVQPTRLEALSWISLALGVPGDTHFLAWAYDEGLRRSTHAGQGTNSQARYCWFDYESGFPDNSRNFTPELGDFPFDSQFVILAPEGGGGLDTGGGGWGTGGGGGGGGTGGGGGGEPSVPEAPPIPSNNGIEGGKLVNPYNYFFSLVNGRMANNGAWIEIMREIGPAWYAYGQGQQNDSGGEPRGRLFLSHAGCTNVAPRNPAEEFLGVRQDTSAAWESITDVVLADGQSWTWNQTGPAFVTPP